MASRTRRGFKLHTLKLHSGQKQSDLAFDSDAFSYASHVEVCVREHLLNVRLTKKPRLDSFTRQPEIDSDSDLGSDVGGIQPFFEVESVSRDGRRLSITYHAGNIGSYRWARPAGAGDALDVSDHAVGNEQRAIFLFPPPGGKGALLVAESAGRAAGEHTLRGWLAAASKAERGQDPHWRLSMTTVADPEHVRELINEDAVREIVLQRREETPDRSTSTTAFKISSQLKLVTDKKRVVDRLLAWVTLGDQPLSNREGAKQLAAIIDPRFADLEFTDGYVKVGSDEDSGQRLRPDLGSDIFTYRLPPGWLTDSGVLQRAREVAQRTRELSVLDLPWP